MPVENKKGEKKSPPFKWFGVVDIILGTFALVISIVWKTAWRSPYDAMSGVLLFLAIAFLVKGILSIIAGVWFVNHENRNWEYVCAQTAVIASLMLVGVAVVGASLNVSHTKHTGAVFKLYFDDYAKKFNIDSVESLEKMETKTAKVIVPNAVFFMLLLFAIILYIRGLIAFSVSAISNDRWLIINVGVFGPTMFCTCGILVVLSLSLIHTKTSSGYGRTYMVSIPFMTKMSSVMSALLIVSVILLFHIEFRGDYNKGRWDFSGLPLILVVVLLTLIIYVGCIGGTIYHLVKGYSHTHENIGCAADRLFERVCSGKSDTNATDTVTKVTKEANGDGNKDARECAAIVRGMYHYNLLTAQAAPLQPRSDPPCYNLHDMAADLVKKARNGAKDLQIRAAWLSALGMCLFLAIPLMWLIVLSAAICLSPLINKK